VDRIFAPWRIEWVERDEGEGEVDGCPFCVLPDRGDDEATRVVARGDHAFVLLNHAPYNPGHVMVIPDRHVDGYGALSAEETASHAHLRTRTLRALRGAFDPDGLNTGTNLGGSAAGGSIDDHVHEHVVPRWSGDTSFMPVVSDTKVIVEAVDASYDRLHDAFAAQDGAAETATGAVGLPV
jgi:ATP adenylyltransferase